LHTERERTGWFQNNMLNIVTIVGARPQFVKAAVLSRLFREKHTDSVSEYIIHTGQHYDENMSDTFFREMNIPEPSINLGVGSGTHGKMTGRMLEKIEQVLIDNSPEMVLVYGDTNSTLAGALAASKLHIPVAHVESGLRSYNKRMPEEQNRVLTDYLSTFRFCPTDTAVKNLSLEGITDKVYKTGDIMYDAALYYSSFKRDPSFNVPKEFFLITLHRAENTDDRARLQNIVELLNEYTELPAVLPLHPRTKKMLNSFDLSFKDHIQVIDPVGYLDMLYLEKNCRFIVTDSGGVQKEAYFFKKPCITLREQTEWVETVEAKANILIGSNKIGIAEALGKLDKNNLWIEHYGDGNSAELIIKYLLAGK